MKPKEVRSLTAEDLDTKLVDLRQKLYSLRVQSVTQKIEDNSQICKTRRDIARLLTERRARQIAATPVESSKA